MAYFDHEVSLFKMIQHIYGNTSIVTVAYRPNMFVKDLNMYLDYLKNEIATVSAEITAPQIKKWNLFKNNLAEGIGYYQSLFSSYDSAENKNQSTHSLLHFYKEELANIEIPQLKLA